MAGVEAGSPSEPLSSAHDCPGAMPRRPGIDPSSVWQITSMTLGAGIFTVPTVFNELGYLHASLWVVVMGVFAEVAMERLLDVSEARGKEDYEALSEAAFGSAGKTIMSVITLVTTFIAALSYVSTTEVLLLNLMAFFITDVDVNSLAPVEVVSPGRVAALLAVIVMAVLPMTLPTHMGDNAWISKLGVWSITISTLFFVGRCIVIMAEGCDGGIACGDRPAAFKGSATDVFEYAATLAFSYSAVFALFPVLQERTIEYGSLIASVGVLRRTVRCSIIIVCTLYLAIGLIGSFTFGSKIDEFALLNLPLKEPLTQIITLVVICSTWLLTAIVGFPAVSSADFLAKMSLRSLYRPGIRVAVVVLLGSMMVVLDTFVSTKVAFTMCGALGLSVGAYVMPCVLFYRLDSAGGAGKRAITALVMVFGLLLLFGSTPITVIQAMQKQDGPAPKPLKSLICGSEAGGAGVAGLFEF